MNEVERILKDYAKLNDDEKSVIRKIIMMEHFDWPSKEMLENTTSGSLGELNHALHFLGSRHMINVVKITATKLPIFYNSRKFMHVYSPQKVRTVALTEKGKRLGKFILISVMLQNMPKSD